MIVRNGLIQVQYNDGSQGITAFHYPADLVKPAVADQWYVLRIVIDDTRGSYVEVYPESDPSQRASYQQYLPTGQAWRFRHWIKSGSVYLDDYREFSASGMTWLPDERVDYGYDALSRLTSAAQVSGANGFSQSYQYDAIGNLTYRSDVGAYIYPASGPTSVRPHAASAAGEWLQLHLRRQRQHADSGRERRQLHADVGRREPNQDDQRQRPRGDLHLRRGRPAGQEGRGRPDHGLHRQLLRKERHRQHRHNLLLRRGAAHRGAPGGRGLVLRRRQPGFDQPDDGQHRRGGGPPEVLPVRRPACARVGR